MIPTDPSPAPSVPAQTHTPYPDVLNPIEELDSGRPSPAAPATTRHSEKQQQQRQNKHPYQQQYTHAVPPRSQQFSEPSPYQTSHLNLSTDTFHLPPAYDDHTPEADLNVYNELFTATSGMESVAFPGWFVTNFDEHNLLSEFGFDGGSFEAHEEGVEQGYGMYRI